MGEHSALPTGTEFTHFRVVGKIGAGGMGEVYRAHDLTLERDVALKVLPAELLQSVERVRRFVQEAKAASALNHPNIVTIYEIGQVPISGSSGVEQQTLHFIAMEFIDGETLRSMIYRGASRSRLLELMVQVAEGLSKAHTAGIIHRDLKPDNVMVTSDGYAKIVDFGLAKLTEKKEGEKNELTQEGMVMGSVGYMSPEQVQGLIVDPRSDIFSFGVILYEALVRKRPFHAELAFDTLHRIVFSEPAPLEQLDASVPLTLRKIVMRCLQKKPDDRYQSIRDVGSDLRIALREIDLSTQEAPTVVTPGAPAVGAAAPPAAPPPSAPSMRLRADAVAPKPAPPPPRRRTFRQTFRAVRRGTYTAALLALIAFGAYTWFTFPDLRSLKTKPPSTTAVIEAAAEEGKALPNYHWVSYGEVSPALRRSIVETDDPAFYDTERPTMQGLKATFNSVMNGGRFTLGPSRLARNVAAELYLGADPNVIQRLRGWTIALALENMFEKRELLELHLNVTPFDETTVGAEAASRKFFRRSANALSTRQATLLAAAREMGEWNVDEPGGPLKARQEELQSRVGARGSSRQAAPSKSDRSRKETSSTPDETAPAEHDPADKSAEPASSADAQPSQPDGTPNEN